MDQTSRSTAFFYDDIQASGCEHIGTNQIDLDNDTISGILAWLGITTEAAAAAGGFYT
jgi:urea transporter